MISFFKSKSKAGRSVEKLSVAQLKQVIGGMDVCTTIDGDKMPIIKGSGLTDSGNVDGEPIGGIIRG